MSGVNYDAKVFGNRLKKLRKTFGKTQQDIADLLFVSVDSISGYETGKTMIGHDYILTLCEHFNISADYFYFGGHAFDDINADMILKKEIQHSRFLVRRNMLTGLDQKIEHKIQVHVSLCTKLIYLL